MFYLMGPVKSLISKILYLMITISFFTMQILVEWQKSKMDDNNSVSSIIQKTGLVMSLIIIFMASANLIINNLFFRGSKNERYFLSQDFVNVFAACIIIPLIFIWKNPTMKKCTRVWITNNIKIIGNKVHPLSTSTNMK